MSAAVWGTAYGASTPALSFAIAKPAPTAVSEAVTGISVGVRNAADKIQQLFQEIATSISVGPKPVTRAEISTISDIRLAAVEQVVLRERSRLDVLIEELRKLGAYEAGWWDADSLPASKKAVDEAEKFLRKIDWDLHCSPIISLADDGEVNFVWMRNGLHLDIGFFGDGRYVFFCMAPNGESITENGRPAGLPLPDNVLRLIRND